MIMTKYTYVTQYAAHFGGKIITVPDQVACAQRDYADRDASFPAMLHGKKIRVRIDADATGLYTTGAGDLCVVSDKRA